ncbi:hypothetical protein GCM10011613_01380 [Cellvibrio zantedeschiae]|uniref:PepSY domain-containing protein n=1 Tax=Cellvibrio zantedeschiae TaxID=1237077 RepID=A0ABQ3ARD5_9GAMM|nr:PepSY domain-containing protein [Cellvibrio zantedeschiae]GGY61680.1 hypothetical protein GCM10011613_01380 [Cellvibrio zantedeschiae]
MQASKKLSVTALLSPLAIALVLAAPQAFAKKDLFGSEPGAKQSQHVEQLVPNASSSSAPAEAIAGTPTVEPAHIEDKVKAPAPETNTVETRAPEAKAKAKHEKESEKPPSYLEKQFSRFKTNLAEAKEDLFGNKKSAKKDVPSVPQQTEPAVSENAHSGDDTQPEVPTISATEAAQRAQALAEGQVINVRKYQEDDKPRYAVKLLQKNGRMKTINLDAVSGTLIEDTPQ